jgi:predicted transcriptional regulator of viral defense system
MYGLSKQETAILARLSAQGKTIFSVKDVWALKIGSQQSIWSVLSRLAAKGWIRRLRRAIYMIVPLEAGIQQTWAEDPFKLAHELFSPCYIAYRSALSYWQLTEQVPSITTVAVPRRQKLPQLAAIRRQFRFVILAPHKFFGFTPVWRDNTKVNISDVEKTILDCLEKPQYAGGIDQAIQALLMARQDRLDLDKLDAYLQKFRNNTLLKRTGFLLDYFGALGQAKKKDWQARLNTNLGLLDPLAASEGKLCREWRLRINMDIKRELMHDIHEEQIEEFGR